MNKKKNLFAVMCLGIVINGCVQTDDDLDQDQGGADGLSGFNRNDEVYPTIELFLATRYGVDESRIDFSLPTNPRGTYTVRGSITTGEDRLRPFSISVIEETGNAGSPAVFAISAFSTDDSVVQYDQPSMTHYGCELLRSIPNVPRGSQCRYSAAQRSVEIEVQDGEMFGSAQSATFNDDGQLIALRLTRLVPAIRRD